MGWREFLKGKNQPPARRHGGTPPDNVAKKLPKKPRGNGKTGQGKNK